jgi:hypothetical protein
MMMTRKMDSSIDEGLVLGLELGLVLLLLLLAGFVIVGATVVGGRGKGSHPPCC